MYSKVFYQYNEKGSIEGISIVLDTPGIRTGKRSISSEVVCLPSPSVSVQRAGRMWYVLCFNKNELWPYYQKEEDKFCFNKDGHA